jgi:hypothetical protein
VLAEEKQKQVAIPEGLAVFSANNKRLQKRTVPPIILFGKKVNEIRFHGIFREEGLGQAPLSDEGDVHSRLGIPIERRVAR